MNYKGGFREILSFRIDEKTFQELVYISVMEHKTISDVVRELIKKGVEKWQ